jgi:hypothetical protein
MSHIATPTTRYFNLLKSLLCFFYDGNGQFWMLFGYIDGGKKARGATSNQEDVPNFI